MVHRVEVSITGTEHTPGLVNRTERITDSVSVSVERPERGEALAYALDFLGRLSVPLDARPLHPERADADAQTELATRITERLRPMIAEIAADPAGEWFNGAGDSTMERFYATIIQEVTR